MKHTFLIKTRGGRLLALSAQPKEEAKMPSPLTAGLTALLEAASKTRQPASYHALTVQKATLVPAQDTCTYECSIGGSTVAGPMEKPRDEFAFGEVHIDFPKSLLLAPNSRWKEVTPE